MKAEYTDHLSFAQDVIERSQLPQEISSQLYQLIAKIQKRLKDPTLYLAIIGEFSSGKSTFVNALLREQDLLKTSVQVTTANATKIRYGRKLDIEVEFSRSPTMLKASTQNQLQPQPKSNIPWPIVFFIGGIITFYLLTVNLLIAVSIALIIIGLYSFRGESTAQSITPKTSTYTITSKNLLAEKLNVRNFIHQVTANENVARTVLNINITHPARFLENGITIIDTPGTNAMNIEHANITKRVVEQEADAAIVMIPANQPGSETLMAFLNSYLKPYLHRCIFVITFMDLYAKEEKRQINYNRQKLCNSLDLEKVDIYTCAAQIVIDSLSSNDSITPNNLVWIDKFKQMENAIFDKLQQEREQTIATSIERLFGQLFAELEQQLQIQWQQYDKKQQLIKQQVIQDLDIFTQKQLRECQSIINRAETKATTQIGNDLVHYRQSALDQVKQKIFAADNWESLSYVVSYEIESILQNSQNSLQSSIKTSCQNLIDDAKKAGEHFDQTFAQAYENLKVLGGKMEILSSVSATNLSFSTYTSVAAAKSINQNNFGNKAKGFFSKIFTGMLEERKRTVWDLANRGIYDFFEKFQQPVQQVIATDAKNLQSALNQRINAYIAEYKATVEEIKRQQKEELQRLQIWQKSIESDRTEMERRKATFTAL